MEWVDGVKLTDKAAMAAAGLNVVDFVDVGIECTLRQLLEHGYFHADPQCVCVAPCSPAPSITQERLKVTGPNPLPETADRPMGWDSLPWPVSRDLKPPQHALHGIATLPDPQKQIKDQSCRKRIGMIYLSESVPQHRLLCAPAARGTCWRRAGGDLCYLDFGMMSEAPQARMAPVLRKLQTPEKTTPGPTAAVCSPTPQARSCSGSAGGNGLWQDDPCTLMRLWLRGVQNARYAIIAHVVHLGQSGLPGQLPLSTCNILSPHTPLHTHPLLVSEARTRLAACAALFSPQCFSAVQHCLITCTAWRGNYNRACPLQAMCEDYYRLDFMDRSVDTSPIAPALAAFFDDVPRPLCAGAQLQGAGS